MGNQQQQGGAPDFEAMSRLSPEHSRFEPFVGTFRATVKLWMGPGEPMVSTGTMVNTLELGGRYLHQHYTGNADPGPFSGFQGRGYWGYNTMSRKWEGFWIDSASTMMQTESGTLDSTGKVWEMRGSYECGASPGGKMSKRSVITLIDNNRHTLQMFMPGPDGKETKGMEIAYERAK